MKTFKQRWVGLPIGKKASSFIMLLTAGLAVVFIANSIIINLSLSSLGSMARDPSACVAAMQAMRSETNAFSGYVRNSSEENLKLLEESCEATLDALENLPGDYEEIGAERFARTWRIRNMFDNYASARNRLTDMASDGKEDIPLLYEVYEMQEDLIRFCQDLTEITVAASADTYQRQKDFLRWIPLLLALMAAAIVLVTAAGSKLLTDSLVSPLQKLSAGVRRISENDFSGEDMQVDSEDELGELVRAFNQMKSATAQHFRTLEENRVLSEELHREELRHMETEKQLDAARLDLLQSQMDPHFLFNTLNTISGMAELEEAETTDRMIRSLASIFRYNLQTTAQFVPLSRELKVVRDYMYLQQMRFGDRVGYEEEIQPDCEPDRAEVPVLIIQPLVENAVIHGLSHSLTGGRVRISAARKNLDGRSFLSIAIEDTGLGMDGETLGKIRESLKGERPSGRTGEKGERRVGIGLGNVAWRIRNTYPDGDVTIDSEEGKGTTVRLLIPEEIWDAEVV